MGDVRRLLIAAHVLLDLVPVSRARQCPYLFGSICGKVVLIGAISDGVSCGSMFLGIGNEICCFNFSIEYFLMDAISLQSAQQNSAFISIQYQYKAVLKLILKKILLLNRLLNIESGLRIYRALTWRSDCNQAPYGSRLW